MNEVRHGLRPSSIAKRAAIGAAATEVFARDGFDRASMDEIASRASVSKQTLYAQFGNKDGLFAAVVTRSTGETFAAAHEPLPDTPTRADQVETFLRGYARDLLEAVLQPSLIALRRLVIAEQHRFPDLAASFWEDGALRAQRTTAAHLADLHERGLLHAPDALGAASTLNWLILAGPLNEAMFRGDELVPGRRERRRLADHAVRVFLAAHTDRS